MDERVERALARWPNVPDLFGWLGLNRRGQWLIQNSVVTNRRLFDVISRNYDRDEHGRWFFQNGPQRGYVALDYTPLVLHAQPDDSLLTHTGLNVSRVEAVYLDEAGSLVLDTEHGPGLLCDQDLEWALSQMKASGNVEDALGEALNQASDETTQLTINVADETVTVQRCDEKQLPGRLSFVREPEAEENEA